MNIKERTKIKKGRLNTITCAIHFSLMASLDTASPQCNVRISNGTLGKPPAAGKNSSAVPLVGRLGCCCCCCCYCHLLLFGFFTCKGKIGCHIHNMHTDIVQYIKKKATHKQIICMSRERQHTYTFNGFLTPLLLIPPRSRNIVAPPSSSDKLVR